MFPKYLRRILPAHRQVHLTMQVHKYGKTNPMESKAICGHWDAFFMRWLP